MSIGATDVVLDHIRQRLFVLKRLRRWIRRTGQYYDFRLLWIVEGTAKLDRPRAAGTHARLKELKLWEPERTWPGSRVVPALV